MSSTPRNMKNNHVIRINKPINLSDLNIRPIEICWGKVKMTSSRWIACCHRRLVPTHSPSAGIYRSNSPNHIAEAHHSPTTFIRSSAVQHNHHHHNHHHNNHLQDHHYPPPHNHYGKSFVANNAISSSYQTPPQRHRQNVLPSSMSSANSQQQTPSNSPMSSSSMYDLGRKSSSSSSSSSTNSFTAANERLVNHSMKHSRSTVDLASGLQMGLGQKLRHHQHFRPRDDSALSSIYSPPTAFENTITILSPIDGLLINCQTNGDSNCAQISPQLSVIAVSNEYWIAFYSIKTNECLGTLQFPSPCLYWTWIRADTVAIVTKKEVFHWSLSKVDSESNYIHTHDFLRPIFSIDYTIRDNQITDYRVDPLSNWCALSTLFLDDDGEIGGKIQIYSHSYSQSQCIEAHSCTFASHQFDDSDHRSTLLVTVRRQKDGTWKLHIIELGPIPNGNLSHKSVNQVLSSHIDRFGSGIHGTTEDIPTHIVCDGKIGLIYLMSKYGSFYICDLQTGIPLHFDMLSDWTGGQALFAFAFDSATDSLVAVCRNGQVLTMKISLIALVHEADSAKAPKAWERIRHRLQQSTKSDEMINGDSVDASEATLNSTHYLSMNSVDSCGSTAAWSALYAKPSAYHYGQPRMPDGEFGSLSSYYRGQAGEPNETGKYRDRMAELEPSVSVSECTTSSFAANDDGEQITRL